MDNPYIKVTYVAMGLLAVVATWKLWKLNSGKLLTQMKVSLPIPGSTKARCRIAEPTRGGALIVHLRKPLGFYSGRISATANAHLLLNKELPIVSERQFKVSNFPNPLLWRSDRLARFEWRSDLEGMIELTVEISLAPNVQDPKLKQLLATTDQETVHLWIRSYPRKVAR